MPSNFQISRLHQLVVNRKINYVFSHSKNFYNPVGFGCNQRLDGVVEIIETFRRAIAGSNPSTSVLFFRDPNNFQMPKKG